MEKKGYFFYCGLAGKVPAAIERSILRGFNAIYNKSEEETVTMLNIIPDEDAMWWMPGRKCCKNDSQC